MKGFTARQVVLHEQLVKSIRAALPLTRVAVHALESADSSYRAIATVLISLRHEFFAPDGRSPDLKGRSRGYRHAVRTAYHAAGAADGPVQKRLTAGVAYWARKLLIERYGETELREIGVLPVGSFASVSSDSRLEMAPYGDPSVCLATVVELLNKLATDDAFIPDEDLVRSAARAVLLMQFKAGIRPNHGIRERAGAA